MITSCVFSLFFIQQHIDDLLVVEITKDVAKSGTELMDGQPMKLTIFLKYVELKKCRTLSCACGIDTICIHSGDTLFFFK